MLQINIAVTFVAMLSISAYQSRKNPLSRKVLERMNDENSALFTKLTDLKNTVYDNLYTKLASKVQVKISRSDLDITTKEYMSFLTIGATIGFLVGFLVFPAPGLFKFFIFIGKNTIVEIFLARVLAGAFVGALGMLTPEVVLKVKASKRRKELEDQLIDFILSLADGIKTARTPQEALRVVADEMPDPISSELRKVVRDIDYSVSYEDALEKLSDRLNSKEYSLVISAMQIQSRTGGHLERMLRNTAKVSEERRETRSEVLKIVRETQNSAYVLTAAPFVLFFGMIFLMKDEFTQYLFSFMGLIYFLALSIIFVVSVIVMYAITKEVKKVL